MPGQKSHCEQFSKSSIRVHEALCGTLTRVGLVEVHEEWWHDEEEGVGDRVEELCDEGAEGVVLLAPVHRRAPPQKVVPQHRRVGLASPLPPRSALKPW